MTINRILKRHGLAGQRPYQRRGTPYPALAAQRPNQVHQLDLVGPRYLRGGERFYGVQLMDAYSNPVALAAMPSKQAVDVVEAVVAGWQKGAPHGVLFLEERPACPHQVLEVRRQPLEESLRRI